MEPETNPQEAPTLAQLIAALGPRNGVVVAAHKAIEAAGIKMTLRGVNQVASRNGAGNQTVALALFEALAAAQETQRKIAERRAAVGA